MNARRLAAILFIFFLSSDAVGNEIIKRIDFEGICATCATPVHLSLAPGMPAPGTFFSPIDDASAEFRSATINRPAEVASLVGAEPLDPNLIPLLAVMAESGETPSSLILDYSTTAVALVYLSPLLGTEHQGRGLQIVSTINSIPQVEHLAQWLSQNSSYSDLDRPEFAQKYAAALAASVDALAISSRHAVNDRPSGAAAQALHSFAGTMEDGHFDWSSSDRRFFVTHESEAPLDSVSMVESVIAAQESAFVSASGFIDPPALPLLAVSPGSLLQTATVNAELSQIPSPFSSKLEALLEQEFGSGSPFQDFNIAQLPPENRVVQLRAFFGSRVAVGSAEAQALASNPEWKIAHERARKTNMMKATRDFTESLLSLATMSISNTTCAEQAALAISTGLSTSTLDLLVDEGSAATLIAQTAGIALDVAIDCSDRVAARVLSRLLPRLAPYVGPTLQAWSVVNSVDGAASTAKRLIALFSIRAIQQGFVARRQIVTRIRLDHVGNHYSPVTEGNRSVTIKIYTYVDPPLLTGEIVDMSFSCENFDLCNNFNQSQLHQLDIPPGHPDHGIFNSYLWISLARNVDGVMNVRSLCGRLAGGQAIEIPLGRICGAAVDAAIVRASLWGNEDPYRTFVYFMGSEWNYSRGWSASMLNTTIAQFNQNFMRFVLDRNMQTNSPTAAYICGQTGLARLVDYTITENGHLFNHSGWIRYADRSPPVGDCLELVNQETRPFFFAFFDPVKIRASTTSDFGSVTVSAYRP